MKISVKLTQREYIKLMFFVTYKKPVILIMNLIGILSITYFTVDLVNGGNGLINIFFWLIMLIGLPLSVYLQAVKNYKSSPIIKEVIQYEILSEKIKITSNSFNSEFQWGKIYKVEESKDWFLIYHNNLTANILPKYTFANTDIEAFKTILKQVPELKLRLRK
jgi:hypothetical protein